MKSKFASVLVILIALPFMPLTAQAAKYICPPCGSPCDKLVFDHPGVCPNCGMTLVDASTVKPPSPDRTKVAILLFDGVEIIDSMGPYEIFGAADFNVYTVGAKKAPVTSAMGQTLTPAYSFADAPAPDVLVVPGGAIGAATRDKATLEYVRDTTAKTKLTMSVCNGAFILGDAGLLDGLTATTTAHNIERMRALYPKVKVVADRRFVDNGRIITTGGLSAGIDGALHVVERLKGTGHAQEVALGEEYDWTAHARFARAALADQLIPDVPIEDFGKWDLVRTEGDTTHWDLEVQGTSDLTAEALADKISNELTSNGKWTAAPAREHGDSGTRSWHFKGHDGEAWGGRLSVHPKEDMAHGYTLKLSVARAG